MKKKRVVVVLLLLGFAFIQNSCGNENEFIRDYPRVKTLSVIYDANGAVTFQAEIISKGTEDIIDHGFVWEQREENISYDSDNKFSKGEAEGKGYYEATLNSFSKSSRCYVKAYVKTQSYLVFGVAVPFNGV